MMIGEEYRATRDACVVKHGHLPRRLSSDMEERGIAEARAGLHFPVAFDGALKAQGVRVLVLASLPPGTLLLDDREGDDA